MVMKDSEKKKILEYVKAEPRTIQDISKLIKRSWVTTDSYVRQIAESTGLISIKTFRAGSQAALKIAFYQTTESVASDDKKEAIYGQIRSARTKHDFDFLDVYQYVPDKLKRAFIEEYSDEAVSVDQHIFQFLRQAKHTVFCFSGNLSFINMEEKGRSMMSLIEELLKAKVQFKVICRVNIASISNIKKLSILASKYPGLVEINHSYQPLRGFIIDDKIARFKNEEHVKTYKSGELRKNSRIFYEIYDPEWVGWLQNVFWNIFKVSVSAQDRMKEILRIH